MKSVRTLARLALPIMVTLLLIGSSSAEAALQGGKTDAPGLDRQKTRAEVGKLEAETVKLEDEGGSLGALIRLAPFLTAIVGLVGLFITLAKQRGETARQRVLDREERDKARMQRFDEQFQQVAENLSSKEGATRAAAIASIEMFMRPEYKDFHARLFTLLLGALRFPRKDFSDRLLVRAFQRSAREQIPAMGSSELDLSNCMLARVELQGIDLSGVDCAFADLHGADLSRADLRRIKGYEVNLSDARLSEANLQEARLVGATLRGARLAQANLVSTKLKGADATGAIFRGARMQEVQLDQATLRGAKFEGADLDNAFFRGAVFDDAALRGIALGARKWRKANWDKPVLEALEQISAST